MWPLPTGQQVIEGEASFNKIDNTTLEITTSDKAIIDYSQFNINNNETVHFQQPSEQSVVLNRITGNSATDIYGTITAPGKVFIINPNGIYFGPESSVNTGSFIASILDISNDNFLAEKYHFNLLQNTNGEIINEGKISIHDNGFIGLFGPKIINNGNISANLGHIMIGSGSAITMDFDGDDLVSFVVAKPVEKSLISNSGTIEALSGRISIEANVIKDVVDNAINNEGLITANKIIEKGGVIKLVNDNGSIINNGTIDASTNDFIGGCITLEADKLTHTGSANTNSSKTNAGHIKMYGENELIFSGTASACSVYGNGGLIELLGNVQLLGIASCLSTNRQNGTLFIDPLAIIIDNTNTPGDPLHMSAQTLVANLNGNNLILHADETITVNTAIDASNNQYRGNLTFQAPTINLNQPINIKEGSALCGHSSNCTVNVAAPGIIQNAIDLAADNATINAAAGRYYETITIDKPLTLIGAQANIDPSTSNQQRTGESPYETIIDGQCSSSYIINISSDDVTINGLDIANNTTKDAIYAAAVDNIDISYCMVHDIGNDAIKCKNITNFKVDSLLAYNVNQSAIHITKSPSCNPIITNSEIHSCRGTRGGIKIDQCDGQITISGNNIHDNQSTGIVLDNCTGTTNKILQNTISGNLGGGIYCRNTPCSINHNIIADNSNYGLYNDSSFTIDSSQNWWNDIHGPQSNDNPQPTTGGSKVIGPATTTPWYTTPTMEDNVLVTHNDQPMAYSDTISTAIEIALSNDTIGVDDGTYIEDLHIDKPLNIIANNDNYTIQGNVILDSQDISISDSILADGYHWDVTTNGDINDAAQAAQANNIIKVHGTERDDDFIINHPLIIELIDNASLTGNIALNDQLTINSDSATNISGTITGNDLIININNDLAIHSDINLTDGSIQGSCTGNIDLHSNITANEISLETTEGYIIGHDNNLLSSDSDISLISGQYIGTSENPINLSITNGDLFLDAHTTVNNISIVLDGNIKPLNIIIAPETAGEISFNNIIINGATVIEDIIFGRQGNNDIFSIPLLYMPMSSPNQRFIYLNPSIQLWHTTTIFQGNNIIMQYSPLRKDKRLLQKLFGHLMNQEHTITK